MNILGMGPLEILVIGLVAFILLGPQKMVDAARLLGKASKEFRRMTDELPKIVLDEEPPQPARQSSSAGTPQDDQPKREGAGRPDEEEEAADGPVAFRPARTRPRTDKTDRTQDRDT